MSGIGFFIVPKDEDIFSMDPQDLADSLYALADSPVCGLPDGEYDVIPIGARRTLEVASLDPDTASYIAAGEAEDGEPLEPAIVDAFDAFVRGCKDDASPLPGVTNWQAMAAGGVVPLLGWRTLAAALLPLVGPAPTNNNFVSADYNRITGLKGDGTTKFLGLNRAGNADPQDNSHMAVYCTELVTTTTYQALMGGGSNETGANNILVRTARWGARVRFSTFEEHPVGSTPAVGLFGVSRGAAENYQWRNASASGTQARASSAPSSANLRLFGRGDGAENASRAALVSSGEPIDLAALQSRVATLTAAINEALT